MKEFTVEGWFDKDAGVWLASNDRLPLTTEAPTLGKLKARVLEIAPQILEANGHIAKGEAFTIRFLWRKR
jgi:hypothetical protein